MTIAEKIFNASSKAASNSLLNLTDKPAKYLGNVIAAKLRLCFNHIILQAKESDYLVQAKYEDFMKRVDAGLDDVPLDDRIDMPRQMAVKISDNIDSSIEEDSLRKMFANLLVSSCDRTKLAQVHPAFPTIISELSKVDAEIISAFSNTPSMPIVNYRNQNESGEGTDIKVNIFYLDCDYQNMDLNSASISNLVRLGLLEVSSSSFIDKSLYIPFVNDPFYLNYKNLLAISPDNFAYKQIDIIEKNVYLTPFGQQFVNSCVSTPDQDI